jgi:Tfp pilus assembly protein PilN
MESWYVLRQIAERLRKAFHFGRPEPFDINLSSRHRAYVDPLRWVLVSTCGLLVLIILWDAVQTVIGYQEVARISQELERVRQADDALLAEVSRDGFDLSEGALQLLPSEVAFANQLLAKRMFSWTKFLTGLEQAIPPRVALTSVRLDAGGTVVHLTGAAVSLEDITVFTVGLQEHPSFKDPVLAQHRSGSSGLVEFDVTLRYRQEGI